MKINGQFLAARVLAVTVFALVAMTATAGEFRVQAPVIQVEVLPEPDREVEQCGAKPSSGLGATLAWDLGMHCEVQLVPSTQIRGYRVFYEWDNRTYSQVMAEYPGATIPLKVRVD